MTTRSRASSSSSSATAHTATTCSANEARAIHDLLVGKRATLVDALQASAQQAGLQPGKVAASTSSSALAPPTSSQLEGPGAAKDEDKSATRVDGEAMEDVSMEFDTSASISSGEQSDSGESSTTSRGGIADLGDFSNVFSFLSSGREREPSDEMEQDQDGPAGASQADDVWSALKLPRVQPYPLPTALSANALSSSGRGAKAQARAERGVEQHRDREDNAPMNDDAAAPGQGEKEHLERSSRALRNAKRPGKRERERMRAAAAAATAETADPPAEVQSSAREPPRPVAARERQEAMSLARTVSEDAAAPLPSGMDGSARKAEGVERHGKKSYKEGGPLLRLRRDSPPPHVSLPLSLSDKSRSLPEKLGHVFPHEKHSIEQAIRSGRLYAPGLAALRDNDERSTVAPPNEQAEHGFWPSIMTAQPVTSRRQCPRPVKGKDDADGDTTMASADDERASPKPVPNDFAIAEESQDEEMQAHVEIFVDNSNILYSFLNRLRDRVKHEQHHTPAKGATGKSAPVMVGGKKARMDYTTLFAVLERGRHVRRRVLAGSSPLWQGLETAVEWGYEVSLLQRVPRKEVIDPIDAVHNELSGVGVPAEYGKRKYKEQAVDELLHLKILESLLDHTPRRVDPARRPVLVLATGDAAASQYQPGGFYACVRRALERGWDVEILAFKGTLSQSWVSEQALGLSGVGKDEGWGTLNIVDLERFAEELVA